MAVSDHAEILYYAALLSRNVLCMLPISPVILKLKFTYPEEFNYAL
jgi:hypothetical protein